MKHTLDVLVDPVKSLLNIQNAKVLCLIRVGGLELGRVRRSKDALTGVEVDVNNSIASKVCALDLGVAAGASDHSTAIHVDEYLVGVSLCLGIICGRVG